MREIGLSLLSVTGSVAMAVAVKHRQLDIIKDWAFKKITLHSNGSNNNLPWIKIRKINRPYMPVAKETEMPFDFLSQYYDGRSELGEFFQDSVQFKKYLLIGNFMLSFLEFATYIRDPKAKSYFSQENPHERIHPDVCPAWGIMDEHDFVDQIERLFGDLDKILNFFEFQVYDNGHFWFLWRKWKQICLIRLGNNPIFMHEKMNTLILPGEPIE
jgi:hypothetical protein